MELAIRVKSPFSQRALFGFIAVFILGLFIADGCVLFNGTKEVVYGPMSIAFQVLGVAGGDNALLVQIDSGQSVERLLFDCGEGCLSEVPFGEVQLIDHLFFSHLHMDHVAGFDSFFRCTFNREATPNYISGPHETARILQRRFQGFLCNLHAQMSGSWRVADISEKEIRTTRFELREAFAVAHDEGTRPYDRIILDRPSYMVEAVTMEHCTPTLAYIVREKARQNVDTSRLAALGLRPGPWLKQLKEATTGSEQIMVDGVAHSAEELRKKLITETAGQSLAYLTDFLLDGAAMDRLAEALKGCQTMVCEGQYRHADLELARKYFHMTTVLSATLAQREQVGQFVLLHLSDRYEQADWLEMLREAREIFPKVSYPAQWKLEL